MLDTRSQGPAERATPRPALLLFAVGLSAIPGALFGQALTQTKVADFGVENVAFYAVDASELTVDSTNFTYSTGPHLRRFLINTQGFGLSAAVHLPEGALITYMELDGYDASATGQVIASLGVCDFAGQNCVYQSGTCTTNATVCSSVETAGGNFSTSALLTGNGIVVDNYFKRYLVRAGNTTNDTTTAISQIVIGYVLQVSPAPPTASFTDVPTDHPFFRYIEALLASGITAGCGGFTFCPDAPLTRGQMAVFLAKALGLQWP